MLGVVRKRSLLLGLHCGDTLDEILVMNLGRVAPQREHARLDAHRLELRTIEVVGATAKLLKVDLCGGRDCAWKEGGSRRLVWQEWDARVKLLEAHLVVDIHLAGVNLHDARAPLFRRQWELYLAVNAT